MGLQQYLPFTVLKLREVEFNYAGDIIWVATVLTVYGIETNEPMLIRSQYILRVATALTVYGIETP